MRYQRVDSRTITLSKPHTPGGVHEARAPLDALTLFTNFLTGVIGILTGLAVLFKWHL